MSTVESTTRPVPAPLRLGRWVEGHQVGAFFVLTFSVSWTMWVLSYLTDGAVAVTLFLPGGFGPIVSALVLARYLGHPITEWIRKAMVWRMLLRFYAYVLGFRG
jgi:hypothetical protein